MTTEPLPPQPPIDPQPTPPPAAPLPPPATSPALGQPAPVQASRPTSVLAVVSMICGIVGIVGWVIAPLIASVVAVVTGHMARAEIQRSGGTLEGDGMAIAGLVTGWLMIALSLFAVLAIVLFFGGLAALLALVGLGTQL